MDEWRRDGVLNVSRRPYLDLQDGSSGAAGNGNTEGVSVQHHLSTASVLPPMHLPRPNSPMISPRHLSAFEKPPRCSVRATPSFDVSCPPISTSVTDAGIPKILPPSTGESDARLPAPSDGWRLPLSPRGSASTVVGQDEEDQAPGKPVLYRRSLSSPHHDRILGQQQRRAQSTSSPRSQVNLLSGGDAPLASGNVLRRQPLRLRKTCDACGKHKKVRGK